MYSASTNEDYYAEAGLFNSMGSVHHVTERIGSGKMKSKDSEVHVSKLKTG